MARFPIVQRMCPYRDSIADYLDGDNCRLCKRQVHALGAMSDAERSAFLKSCTEEICVTYRLPPSRAVAAVAISAAMMALPVAAQDEAPAPDTKPAQSDTAYEGVDEQELMVLVIGGIRDFDKVEYVDTAEDLETPELPVTYEEGED